MYICVCMYVGRSVGVSKPPNNKQNNELNTNNELMQFIGMQTVISNNLNFLDDPFH